MEDKSNLAPNNLHSSSKPKHHTSFLKIICSFLFIVLFCVISLIVYNKLNTETPPVGSITKSENASNTPTKYLTVNSEEANCLDINNDYYDEFLVENVNNTTCKVTAYSDDYMNESSDPMFEFAYRNDLTLRPKGAYTPNISIRNSNREVGFITVFATLGNTTIEDSIQNDGFIIASKDIESYGNNVYSVIYVTKQNQKKTYYFLKEGDEDKYNNIYIRIENIMTKADKDQLLSSFRIF